MTTDTRQPAGNRLGMDFWKYFTGQLISTLGTSFSMFALPLLIYKLTGSALNLGISMAVGMLPYLLFGLVIGAWVDRLDRKRIMVLTNIALALVMASIPTLGLLGHLSVAYIYAMEFISSTLGIFFNSAEFAAIPSLVGKDDLVTANGRLQASYSASNIVGPILAGLLAAVTSIQGIIYVDAFSFLLAAGSLVLVQGSFNQAEKRERKSVRQDVAEGLRYVIHHPVLRNISIMMALVNFVGATVGAQLVFFAKVQLHAGNSQIGLLFAAEGVGVVVLSLLAGRLRKRWSFSRVALGALSLQGVVIICIAFTRLVIVALPLFALSSGLGILFNINTMSLRQAIVPNHLLGRIISVAGVLAWSAIPLGAILGGLAINQTQNVSLIFAAIGILTVLIPVAFSFTALGHADRFIPREPGAATEGSEAEALTESTLSAPQDPSNLAAS
jgi:MFS family permease